MMYGSEMNYRTDDQPLIPDDQLEIRSTLVVGYRTKLIFRSMEAALWLFQNDQYLDLEKDQYAGSTELAFSGALPSNVVEAASPSGNQVMSARTLIFTPSGLH